MRILSAINMAQLDILGQSSGLPLYRLLGGKTPQRRCHRGERGESMISVA